MRRVALVGMQGAGHESESDSVGIPPICGKIGDGLLLGLPHSWACFIVIRIYDLPYSCSTIVDPLFHLKECAVYLPESGP